MRFIWLSALKDLRRRRRDPLALALWVGIPLIIVSILSLVFGRGGGTPRGRLLIADEDKSLLSSVLTGAFSQGKLGEMLTVEKVDRETGRARLYKGDGSALLLIPKGFGNAVLVNKPVALHLLTNPAQRILPGIIEESLSILTEAAFYLEALLGDRLRPLTQGSPQESSIIEFTVAVNRLAQRLEKHLNPPLIKLQTTVIESGAQTGFNFTEAFFPGSIFMALLFMAQGLSEDLWKERAQGTLRRAAATPSRTEAFLAGKLLGGAALMGVVTLAGLSCARWIFGLRAANVGLAAFWASFFGTVFFLMMMLVQMHASSARAGNVLTNLVLFPLVMLGGSFFPFEVMPASLATIGRWTPNGWALVQFRAILADAVDPTRLAASLAGLAGMGALMCFAGALRLRRSLVGN